MYSPFRNEQGQPKDLADVTYADLSQLADLEEGYVLEFKRTWNDHVRKKIPKIIASFANSRGGWLVIGIADDDKSLCPIPRISADFSQIFGELCRHHVSPTPALMPVLLLTPQTTNKVLWWSKFMKEISLPMWQTEWWKFVKDQRLGPHWVRRLLSFTAKQPNAPKRSANSASELSGTPAIMPLHPTCVPFPYLSLVSIFFVWEVARVSALRAR